MDSKEKRVDEIDGLLTLGAVATLTTLCRNSIRKRARDGRFPQPVSLDGRIAWRRSAVEQWLKALPTA